MRVLFVVKEYLPKPTPPGLCVMNVQKALFEKGIQSDVVMVGDKEGLYTSTEIGDVYSIKSGISFEKKKTSLFDFMKIHIPMLLSWPVPSKKRVNDYRRLIKQLNDKRNYNAIIGTMFPPDVCVACSSFNHFYYYELDSLINNPMYKEGLKKYLKHRLVLLEKKLFNSAELIIHLNHNKKYYSKRKYNRYIDKSVYTDIPELTEEKNASVNELIGKIHLEEIDNHQMLMVYSGHLSREYRSPTRLIELIKNISKTQNVKCLFFSRGDCEDELRQAEEETHGIIKRMGYVSPGELAAYIDKADFLLDIGNCLSGDDYSLPSKVICYMATGKPIIHMNGMNDSAIGYLEKYGLAINVSKDFAYNEKINDIMNFIKENRGKRLLFADVAKMFPENMPAFTADLIIKQINHNS